jgi:hypothetical protein
MNHTPKKGRKHMPSPDLYERDKATVRARIGDLRKSVLANPFCYLNESDL